MTSGIRSNPLSSQGALAPSVKLRIMTVILRLSFFFFFDTIFYTSSVSSISVSASSKVSITSSTSSLAGFVAAHTTA